MVSLENLPIEIIYIIVDNFNPSYYADDYTNALNILRLSRVNRLLNEILWQDEQFYKRLWRKHISDKLPGLNEMDSWINYLRTTRRPHWYGFSQPKELPNVKPRKLQMFYFHTLRELESRSNYYTRLELAVNEEWERVFDTIFCPADFTTQKDDEYYDMYRADQEREYGFDYDDYRRSVGRRIDRLFIASVYHGNRYLVERLMTDDISLSVYNEALHKAVQYGHFEILKRLKEQFSHLVHNPLIVTASEYGRVGIVNYLIELGEDVTTKANMSVIKALANRHYEVVRRLIELGADTSACGHYSLRYACEYGHIETVRLVIKPEYRDTMAYHQSLIIASRKGYTEIVRLMLNIGVDPQASNGNSRPLYEASFSGHLDIINLLLTRDIPLETIGVACCAVIRKKRYDILRRLLDRDFSVKIATKMYAVVIKEGALHMIYQLAKEGSQGAIEIMQCHDSNFKGSDNVERLD